MTIDRDSEIPKSTRVLTAVLLATALLTGCAGLYIPVVGVGQNSDGTWSFMFGGGGGALGAGGAGASCASACTGNPNGEVCAKFREMTKQTCGIK